MLFQHARQTVMKHCHYPVLIQYVQGTRSKSRNRSSEVAASSLRHCNHTNLKSYTPAVGKPNSRSCCLSHSCMLPRSSRSRIICVVIHTCASTGAPRDGRLARASFLWHESALLKPCITVKFAVVPSPQPEVSRRYPG